MKFRRVLFRYVVSWLCEKSKEPPNVILKFSGSVVSWLCDKPKEPTNVTLKFSGSVVSCLYYKPK